MVSVVKFLQMTLTRIFLVLSCSTSESLDRVGLARYVALKDLFCQIVSRIRILDNISMSFNVALGRRRRGV